MPLFLPSAYLLALLFVDRDFPCSCRGRAEFILLPTLAETIGGARRPLWTRGAGKARRILAEVR